MRFLIAFLMALCSYSFASQSTSGQESEHFHAEFWQREDGMYCVKLIEYDKYTQPINSHIYIFEHLIHSQECPCLWGNYPNFE